MAQRPEPPPSKLPSITSNSSKLVRAGGELIQHHSTGFSVSQGTTFHRIHRYLAAVLSGLRGARPRRGDLSGASPEEARGSRIWTVASCEPADHQERSPGDGATLQDGVRSCAGVGVEESRGGMEGSGHPTKLQMVWFTVKWERCMCGAVCGRWLLTSMLHSEALRYGNRIKMRQNWIR